MNPKGVLVGAGFVLVATHAFFELLAPVWERASYPTGDLVVLPGLVLYCLALGALLLVGFSVGAWLADRSERHGVVGRKRVS